MNTLSLNRIGLFLGPLAFITILLLPVPTGMSVEAWRVLAIAALMLIWWISEGVPIPVTSLVPMVALPLLGVQDMTTAAAPYASPIVFLFMGGFMLALALEKWQLHRRIALTIVKMTGTNANGIILGFMLATAFLSMWISNTATAVMMLPIALSVVGLLTRGQSPSDATGGVKRFALALMLGIAYAANIGGTATIIGTPPNVVFAGFMRETFQREVTFAQWMLLGLPFAAILLTLTYWVLVKLLFPNRLGRFAGAQAIIQQELSELGRMDKAERRTLVVFVGTALAWIFRSQLNALLPIDTGDEEIAILATIILFLVPVDFKRYTFLLEWKDTEKLPWGILLLFGGGLSLAAALKEVGLIDLIGAQFVGANISGFWLILGLSAVSLFLTEIMSNVALVTVFLPVVGGVATGLDIMPLYVCVPVTLAASCAFMLPMSTPPNAIVFASGHLRISDMAKAGIVLNLITIVLVAVLVEFLLPLIFS